MGNSDKSAPSPKLNDIALELFKGRSPQPGITPQQLVMNCFRDAKVFLEVADQLVSEPWESVEEETNPLDVAFAPNLKRTHPINLMSRAWGDIMLVRKALSELDANPKAVVYEPYGWGKPEINQARALFPAVVNRANQLATAK